MSVFADLLSFAIADPDHSRGEQRHLLPGVSYQGRLRVASHTERGETIRIVNARRANRREIRVYEGG